MKSLLLFLAFILTSFSTPAQVDTLYTNVRYADDSKNLSSLDVKYGIIKRGEKIYFKCINCDLSFDYQLGDTVEQNIISIEGDKFVITTYETSEDDITIGYKNGKLDVVIIHQLHGVDLTYMWKHKGNGIKI